MKRIQLHPVVKAGQTFSGLTLPAIVALRKNRCNHGGQAHPLNVFLNRHNPLLRPVALNA